jgi:uncharacterized membrane protein
MTVHTVGLHINILLFAIVTEIILVRQSLLKTPSIKFHENSLFRPEVFHTKKGTDR